jgi:hypothetical protein
MQTDRLINQTAAKTTSAGIPEVCGQRHEVACEVRSERRLCRTADQNVNSLSYWVVQRVYLHPYHQRLIHFLSTKMETTQDVQDWCNAAMNTQPEDVVLVFGVFAAKNS